MPGGSHAVRGEVSAVPDEVAGMTRVWIPESLRRYTGSEEWLPAAGGSVRDLLVDLVSRHTELGVRVLDPNRALHSHLVIIVNDEVLPREDCFDRPIRSGDEVRIFVAASGG
jgi:molybdopterin synthase sulfur carrier subunit